MSADLLRRAAAKVREVAEAATPGPWFVDADDDRGVYTAPRPTATSEDVLYGPYNHAGNDIHAALWHPGVALAIADWLDAEADESEVLGSPDAPNVTPAGTAAYTLARLLLGESS